MASIMMLEMEEESSKGRSTSTRSPNRKSRMKTSTIDLNKDKSKSRFGRVYRPSLLQQYRNGNLFRDPNCYGLAGLLLFNVIILLYNLNSQPAPPATHAVLVQTATGTEIRTTVSGQDNPVAKSLMDFPSKEDLFPKKEDYQEEYHSENHLLEYTDDDEYELQEGGARMLKDSLFVEPDVGDCDRFMGNGLEEDPFYICSPWGQNTDNINNDHKVKDQRAEGEIKCHWHKALKSSFCEATNLMVDPSKIHVSAGGEPLHAVKGRDEAEELPTYDTGAFQMSQCNLEKVDLFGETKQLPYHLLDMMKSVREQEDDEQSWYGEIFGTHNAVCSSYEERPTLIVTRYEYANLYHTYSDWYSAYQAAMIALNGKKADVDNVNIVFFDGHAQGFLDFGWKLLFKNATVSFLSEYQQSFRPDDGTPIPVCFRHAIFVPAGYRASTSVTAIGDYSVKVPAASYMDKCGESKWQRRFRDTLVHNAKMHLARWKGFLFDHFETEHGSKHPCHSHHFPGVHHQHEGAASSMVRHRKLDEKKKITHLRVLLLSRQNYYAHPRMDGAVSRSIENEEELMSFLQNYVPSDPLKILSFKFPSIDVRRVVLEEHDITEQIMMFQQANIVVGMHGAGLSHILLARPGTMLMELQPPRFESQYHFKYLASMAGCLYHAHRLDVARPVNHNDPYPVPIQQFELAFMDGVATFLDHHGAL